MNQVSKSRREVDAVKGLMIALPLSAALWVGMFGFVHAIF